MKSKLCFYNPPFPRVKSYYDMIDAAVEHNLSAVEGFCRFDFQIPDTEAAKKIKEYADSKGVIFPCFSVYTDFAAENVEMLKGYAEVARILGSPYLHHTIVGEFEDCNKVLPEKESLFKNGVKAVREIYDYSENIGIKTIYEEQGYIFNGVRGFGEFLDAVNRDVGVVADFGNIYESEDDLLDFLKVYANRVVHAHLKDVDLRDTNDGNGFTTLSGKFFYEAQMGKGVVKTKEAIAILKNAGYDGYYGLEFGASEDSSSLMTDSIKFIETCM